MHKCPICKKEIQRSDAEFPFCSERCRTMDLAKWASGEYKISSPILEPEVLENLGERRPAADPEDDDGNSGKR